MTYGKAISMLESETQETVEASVMLKAIDKILSMATIINVNKNALFNAVMFLRNHVNELLKAKDINVLTTWISVKDRKPDKSGKYLVFCKVGYQDVLNYSTRHKAFNVQDTEEKPLSTVRVTHWMQLPESPKEGDSE